MVDKKTDFSLVSYTFGIMSIVLAFFTPFAGLVFGIIGVVQSKKQKTALSLKAKKLSTIGIVLSVILLIVSLVITYFFADQLSTLGSTIPVS